MRTSLGTLTAGLIGLLAMVWLAAPVAAVDPSERLADPAQEQRARDISAGLRCLVCQNQSIDDSDAALAKDLRVLVRERIKSGDTDAQVLSYVVDRYGEFVLLRPPFNTRTLLLWFAPALLLLGVIGYVVMRVRAAPSGVATAGAAPAPLTSDEQARLGRLIRGHANPDDPRSGGST